jgi:Domain of unknown function (DUF222)
MSDNGQPVQPSSAPDALLMLQRALGYLAGCDAPGLRAAGQAELLAALEHADAAHAAARARIRSVFTVDQGFEPGRQTRADQSTAEDAQTGANGCAGVAGQAAGPASRARDFASGGVLHQARPEPALVGIADEVTGPDGRCPGTSDDELIGVLRFWQREESWAASRKLAVIAELIRRRPAPGCEPRVPSGLPAVWDKFCGDELAAATATSGQAAEKSLLLAYDLATRLTGTARALYDGAIDSYKAKIIADATRVLDDAGAAEAEALALPGIAGKTPGQIRTAIGRAVITVDPEAARERREQAEKDARVELWRQDAGTAALCGYGLPPAEALAADQKISARARELRASGVEGNMDQLRVRAYLDFLLGKDSRLPCDSARSESDQPGDGSGSNRVPEAHPAGSGATARPDASGSGGGPAARINLTIPLMTLLGLADRPGEAHGLGPVDPALARTLATAAAGNARTTWCLTVTDRDGHPIAHGCARPARASANPPVGGTGTGGPGTGGPGNRDGPAFIPEDDHGPPSPDGHGQWRLHTPGPAGRDYTVDIGPLAVTDCDHRDQSAGYQPSDRLRHLTEIRDGECTWPPCRRTARVCDFEHAVPYDQGGKTCACNAGARCRHHHHAKQAPGWRLDQHLPGYHTWTTPSGRTYTTGPTQYPA